MDKSQNHENSQNHEPTATPSQSGVSQVFPTSWRSLSIGLVITVLICSIFVVRQPDIVFSSNVDDISQTELISKLKMDSNLLLLDVRTEREYQEGHIPGAVNIHFQELPNLLDDLRTQNPSIIVVYCETGIRAGIASRTLRKSGFDAVYHLEGDMQAWRSQQHPVARLEL